METKFTIHNFNKLSIEDQKEVQDFTAGITPNFVITEHFPLPDNWDTLQFTTQFEKSAENRLEALKGILNQVWDQIQEENEDIEEIDEVLF